jgi:hypothetical protein
MDGTAGYPRTAKFLQFGGRFDSEGVALARIHIPQLSGRLCGAWVFGACAVLCGKGGGLGGSLDGRLSGLFARVGAGFVWLLPVTDTEQGGLGEFWVWSKVGCAAMRWTRASKYLSNVQTKNISPSVAPHGTTPRDNHGWPAACHPPQPANTASSISLKQVTSNSFFCKTTHRYCQRQRWENNPYTSWFAGLQITTEISSPKRLPGIPASFGCLVLHTRVAPCCTPTGLLYAAGAVQTQPIIHPIRCHH